MFDVERFRYDAQINYLTFSQINLSIHSHLILSESEESTRYRAVTWGVMASESNP